MSENLPWLVAKVREASDTEYARWEIRASLSEIIDADIETFNDMVSERATGSEVGLQDISFGVARTGEAGSDEHGREDHELVIWVEADETEDDW